MVKSEGIVDESNVGMIEINDINIGIKGGKSETDVGGNIDIYSGILHHQALVK